MPDLEALQEYSNSIKDLKKRSRDAGLSEEEFKKMYFQSLNNLETNRNVVLSNYHRINRYRVLLMGFVIIGIYTVYNFKTFYSTVMCNIQEYIYPGLKLVRRISIPLISLFPSLTDFYHETCLIQNPFFTVVDMDCWPCSAVSNVLEVDEPKPMSEQHHAPFIYKTEQQVIDMDTLKKMYIRNKDIIDKETAKILTNSKHYQTPDDVFNQDSNDKNFYVWKFHNIKIAKLLRQIIPRPKVVPKFGQSTERFIIIDNRKELFHVPDTECSFSFLLALSGSREINLLPAEECKHQCKALKVELKETYLLWYNWWYWRPTVQSSIGNQTFIAHVGSYC